MNAKRLLERQICIRLTPDEAGFVCTVKRGGIRLKKTEYCLDKALETAPEPAAQPQWLRQIPNRRSDIER